MPIFGNKDDKEKPKRRSMWGTLFNPDFGNDIRPMGEVITMFVRFVAYIFASNGLFPINHPALTGNPAMNDPAARLTMAEIIRTAYSRLQFTREGLPKVAIFVAVTGTLAFMAIFLLFAVLSLFIGKAHAESMFTPTDPDNDWGLGWINYIFLGQKMNFMQGDIPSGVSDMCDWQRAIGTGLGYYSAGILVLAGVILLYYLMKMVAETAHTGKVMGNASQIWAPIRLVVAIGLLVPIGAAATSGGSSCGSGTGIVTGLNTGQYIVVQMAKWGSGLASNIWEKFVGNLVPKSPAEKCTTSTTNPQSPSCVHVPEAQVRSFALGMISNFACGYIYNYYASAATSSTTYMVKFDSTTHLLGNDTEGLQALCGGFIPLNTDKLKSTYGNVYIAQRNVVDSYLGQFASAADTHYGEFVSPLLIVSPDNTRSSNKDIDDPVGGTGLIQRFQSALDSATQTALDSADQKYANPDETTNNKMFKAGGWLAAGTWFNTLARLNASRSDSVEGALPQLIQPQLFKKASSKIMIVDRSSVGDIEQGWEHTEVDEYDAGSVIKKSASTLNEFNNWLGVSGKSAADLQQAATAGLMSSKSSGESFMNKILNLVDKAAIESNLWSDSSGYLSIKFGKDRNPLAEIAAYGQSMVHAAFKCFAYAAVAFGAGAVASLIPVVGSLAGTIGTLGGTLLGFIATVYMTIGILLGYFLPLVPFVRFFFASLTWIIGVAEALVAAPLLALAHLNPEGEGLPGQQARQGYFFIVNIFLRPALMVFGLVVGYLLFNVGIAFLNTMFIYAAMGTGAYVGELPTFAKIVFSLMYGSLAYVLGQNAFKSIGMFAEHALRWLGSGGHLEKMGEHHTVVGALSAGGSYLVGQQALGLAKAPGEVIAGTGKAMQSRGEANQSAQIAGQRHGQQMAALGQREDGSGPIPGGAATQHIPQVDTDANQDYARQIDPQATGDHRYDDEPQALVSYRAEEQARIEFDQIRAREGRAATPAERADLLRRIVGQYAAYSRREAVDHNQVHGDLMRRLSNT
ncbi:MAG: DotA/TraY family protein [Alphaproteobacteria bacterium]|nr:DotA/TraY family protein [Alphaproteobacteria bacterium]